MMKETLDEAIDALVFCSEGLCEYCPFNKEDRHLCQDAKCAVALGYLKEYRKIKNHLACINNAEIRGDNTQIINNPPLTWNELQTMEGEPVWAEQHHGDTKGWLLILRKCDDVVTCTTKHGNSFYLYKANYGEKWQAYRKER